MVYVDEHLDKAEGMLAEGLQEDLAKPLAVLLVSLELLGCLLGVVVAVEPPPMQVGEAGGQAPLEGRIVEHSGPKLLEAGV